MNRKNSQDKFRILVADDSEEAIRQISAWILERWPEAELYPAQAPEEAIAEAVGREIENLVLDLDFGAQRDSGVAIARKILAARANEKRFPTRVLFRTAHAGDPGYLHQVERLIGGEKQKPHVWGFLDKGAVPKRLAQNAVEQVFIYEVSFTEVFNQRLKDSPSRDLSNLEFTVLIYTCLGATNDGIGWLIGASRQSVERILTELYRKLEIPTRRDAPKAVPALLENRTRLCYEALTRGWVNPQLLREEDAALRERVRGDVPWYGRLYVSRDWLEKND